MTTIDRRILCAEGELCRAGQQKQSEGWRRTYLAPLPVPTHEAPLDYCNVMGEVNDTCLTLGMRYPNPFGFQAGIGASLFTGILLFCFVAPIVSIPTLLTTGAELTETLEFALWMSAAGFKTGLLITCSGLLFYTLTWLWSHYRTDYTIIPSRFNRERREICLVPDNLGTPLFIPWESVCAWVEESRFAPPERRYSLGLGIHDAASGQDFVIEFASPTRSMAIGTWDAIRAYMDFEVHTWHDLHAPQALLRPGDPPHDGLHTFRNARTRLHRRHQRGEVGLWYVAGWYFVHLCSLWTLPFHLTEREVRHIKRRMQRSLPPRLEAWTRPIPPEQWARPSATLLSERARLDLLQREHPGCTRFELIVAQARTSPRELHGPA